LTLFNISTIVELLKPKQPNPEGIVRFADMLSAIGTESRLRITRLLLTAHPEGMVAGAIQAELGISASNLSHHLEKLKHEGVIEVRREGSFLRYTANTDAIQELLTFLFSECCARTKAIKPDKIIRICR
jgi:ArsR family transcriptional regulator, arsenate/arsenite/antimonite-responsive transcriptional repressor